MTDHVKIYGVTPRIQYTADGILTTFEFPFAIFSTSDIDVYLDSTLQETTAYSVLEAGSSDGGSITFVTAPISGTIVTIVRNLSIERTTDFQEGGALRADTLNDELDYQIACQQQIAENLNRSMVLPPYAIGTNINLTLPIPAAGKAIVWNEAGTNLENSTVSVNSLESTLKGYKEAAESASTAATSNAGIATTAATTATQKATEAASAATSVNTQLQNTKTVIETYSNGYDWYRLWSDGWIEQGGLVQLNGVISDSNKRVTFLKPYAGTFIVIPSQDAQTGYDLVVGWQSSTGFSIGTIATASTGNCQWYACGY